MDELNEFLSHVCYKLIFKNLFSAYHGVSVALAVGGWVIFYPLDHQTSPFSPRVPSVGLGHKSQDVRALPPGVSTLTRLRAFDGTTAVLLQRFFSLPMPTKTQTQNTFHTIYVSSRPSVFCADLGWPSLITSYTAIRGSAFSAMGGAIHSLWLCAPGFYPFAHFGLTPHTQRSSHRQHHRHA